MTPLLFVAAGSVLLAGTPMPGWGGAPPAALIQTRVAVESDTPRNDDADQPPRAATNPVEAGQEERPRLLIPLYFSMATWQALDFLSTQRGLKAGVQEGNPVMAPLRGSAGAVIVVKAGVSAMTIYAAERMWKHNRKAAVLTLIGVNLGYAAIVSHNLALAATAPGGR
jgi:hypothetical protein